MLFHFCRTKCVNNFIWRFVLVDLQSVYSCPLEFIQEKIHFKLFFSNEASWPINGWHRQVRPLERENVWVFFTYELIWWQKNPRRFLFSDRKHLHNISTAKSLWAPVVWQHISLLVWYYIMLILFFLCDFKGTLRRLCAAACFWLVNLPVLLASHCQQYKASLNTQNTRYMPDFRVFPYFDLSSVKYFPQLNKTKRSKAGS